jgi:hypothetical protein
MNTNKLNEAYNTQTYETAKKRITLAGYRLANYVVDIYKTALHSDSEHHKNIKAMNQKDLCHFLAEDSKKVNLGKSMIKLLEAEKLNDITIE